RDVVLDRMLAVGTITQKEAEEAKEIDLELELDTPPNGCVPSDEPFFCDYVVQEIEQDERFGPNETERARWLRTAGLEIHTTLVPQTQEAAQDAVDKWVPREHKSRKVAAESTRGETSTTYAPGSDGGGGTGCQAESTFKAIALAAALHHGLPFSTSFSSPASTTVSGHRSCNGGLLEPWTLSNAGESDSGT